MIWEPQQSFLIEVDPDGVLGLSTSDPAVTKRLGNLTPSIRSTLISIDQFLLEDADQEVKWLKAQVLQMLCISVGSVVEKPESRVAED